MNSPSVRQRIFDHPLMVIPAGAFIFGAPLTIWFFPPVGFALAMLGAIFITLWVSGYLTFGRRES